MLAVAVYGPLPTTTLGAGRSDTQGVMLQSVFPPTLPVTISSTLFSDSMSILSWPNTASGAVPSPNVIFNFLVVVLMQITLSLGKTHSSSMTLPLQLLKLPGLSWTYTVYVAGSIVGSAFMLSPLGYGSSPTTGTAPTAQLSDDEDRSSSLSAAIIR